jgi:hypothetical protein
MTLWDYIGHLIDNKTIKRITRAQKLYLTCIDSYFIMC